MEIVMSKDWYLGEAVQTIEQQARREGMGILKLLETVNTYGLEAYIKSAGLDQGPNSGDDFRDAVAIFMAVSLEISKPKA